MEMPSYCHAFVPDRAQLNVHGFTPVKSTILFNTKRQCKYVDEHGTFHCGILNNAILCSAGYGGIDYIFVLAQYTN